MARKPLEPKPLPTQVKRAIATKSAELGLTDKQHAFVEYTASGMGQAEAYRRAYNVTDPKASFIPAEASKLMDNRKISTTLAEGRAAWNYLRSSRRDEWREAIDNITWEIAHDPEAKKADRLQAVKLGGSQVHVQAFAQAQSADGSGDTSIDGALKSLLSELSTQGIVIDIEASPVHSVGITRSVADLTAPSPWNWDGTKDGAD